ncbi:amidohydrolase family protein [Streptomyces sp. NPDC047085]|uniref:amidohydrolase family protein n=1 Tax=Streptomyces sp. NPDC047085 TaxID=3155140 RepID=UPI0033D97E52
MDLRGAAAGRSDHGGQADPAEAAAARRPDAAHRRPRLLAQNVGPDRCPKAWPLRSLQQSGATLAFSSDWNVAEMDPMVGLCTAVTRRPLGGGAAWMPEEAVDIETAIHAYTMGSAYANFLERERGSLTVGKVANLVVLSRDVLAVDPEHIPGTVCEIVMVGGEVVHRA